MPPHGGNTSLSRIEIQRAIVYLVNESGGNWVEPPDPARHRPRRSGTEVVQAHCVLCHATGVDNAPRIGDRAAWLPRTKLGLDPLVLSVVRGHGSMPPRGGKANLTDDELRDAVIYMMSPLSSRSAADREAKRRRQDPARGVIALSGRRRRFRNPAPPPAGSRAASGCAAAGGRGDRRHGTGSARNPERSC